MLNLFEYLTPLDNKRIKNYIHTYGVREELYSGNEKYLKYWAKCKPHLFHLLGGQLIYKFPVCFEKPEAQIEKDIGDFILENDFINQYYKHLLKLENLLDSSMINAFRSVCWSNTFYKDEIPNSIKIKLDGHKKMLQLQKGMKPIRALLKIIDYFAWEDLRKPFEDFRIAHSMIYNDKMIKGNMCISIHPLDFMTMSDNANNWSSCMSWAESGCYHLGTVEMMNSNNVVCCYIESSDSYNFSNKEDKKEDEDWIWNSKKWRQLFYVTNEIIVCGKAYPYQNKDFSLVILNKLKELSEKNLGRTYSFGPEPYHDMDHIGSNQRMINNRNWIKYKNTTKHNIIFDTKGMYNDMFNDHYTQKDMYLCYRNKVKKNTIISYSGKAPCLCCGEPVLEINDLYSNYDGGYNERYGNAGQLICSDCLEDKCKCEICGYSNPFLKISKINGKNICEICKKEYLKRCPDCGKVFIVRLGDNQLYAKITDEEIYQQDFYRDLNTSKKFVPLYMCNDCRNKKRHLFIEQTPPLNKKIAFYAWRRKKSYFISKDIIDMESKDWSKYKRSNLASIDTE